MYIIKTLNAISPVGLAKLPASQFEIDNEACLLYTSPSPRDS